MASIIQIKRSSSNTQPQSLYLGELAYSWATGADKLYIGTGSDLGNGLAETTAIIGGKYFTDKLDHTPGILVANSAIIVDMQGRINRLATANLAVDGVTNLSGVVNINGDVDIGGSVTFENFAANNVAATTITVDNLVVDQPISLLEVNDLTVTGTFVSDDITSQSITVIGDLNVIGSLTSIFSEELNIADNIILLNSNLANTANPTQSAGLLINRGVQENVLFVWDETLDKWSVGTKDFIANLFHGNLNGNSLTADKLLVPITISLSNNVTGSVLFDGSQNVDIQTQISVIYGGTY